MKLFKCGHPDEPNNRRSNGTRNGVKSYRCKTCKRTANSQWQKDNPDKVSERNRRVRERYPEKERARIKRWAQNEGRDKTVASSARYRRKNGVPEWNSPECKKKMSDGAKRRIQRDGLPFSPCPSKLELSCISLFAKRGYRHTGDGSFWIRGKDGKSKNPDFKKNGAKAVIEVWGNYWHRNQNPQDLVDWYQENGFECEIYWESDLKSQLV